MSSADDFDLASFEDDSDMEYAEDSLYASTAYAHPVASASPNDLYDTYDEACWIGSTSEYCDGSYEWMQTVIGVGMLSIIILLFVFTCAWRKRQLHRAMAGKTAEQSACPHVGMLVAQLELARQMSRNRDIESQGEAPQDGRKSITPESPPNYSALFPFAQQNATAEKPAAEVENASSATSLDREQVGSGPARDKTSAVPQEPQAAVLKDNAKRETLQNGIVRFGEGL